MVPSLGNQADSAIGKGGKVEGEADGLGKTKIRISHSEFEM